jgi:hypothetical protein
VRRSGFTRQGAIPFMSKSIALLKKSGIGYIRVNFEYILLDQAKIGFKEASRISYLFTKESILLY